MSTKSIKSNIDSVLEKCGSLAALKRYLTTCLQRWRQKYFNFENPQQQSPLQLVQIPENIQWTQHYHHHHYHHYHHYHHKHNYQLNSKLDSETSENFLNSEYHSNFNTVTTESKTIKSEIPSKQNPDFICKSYLTDIYRYKCGQQFQINAKLLFNIFPTARDRSIHFSSNITNPNPTINCKSNIQNMVYSDINFSEIRENHPDIDAEIRGILLTRAQIGSTISQIRDEYYNLTGTKFPLEDNITDFLLTIPNVLVYCNENGTRIFNILPTFHNKHLFELILNQKQNYRTENKSNHRRQATCYNNYGQTDDVAQTKCLTRSNSEPQHSEYQNVELNIDANNAYEVAKSLNNDTNADGVQHMNYHIDKSLYYHDNCYYLNNRLRNASGDNCNPDVDQQMNPNTESIRNQMINIRKMANIPHTYATNLKHLNDIFQTKTILQPKHCGHLKSLINGKVCVCDNTTKPCDKNISLPLLTNQSEHSYTNQVSKSISDFDAHLLDFLLLGDDFFLYMARMELGCKFKRGQPVLQSGLCVSGQSISDAIKRINQLNDWNGCIIVNIGSVDIMQYHKLIQIEYEFRKLIDMMLNKNITPILTTLAPLGNYMHYAEIPGILNRFNEFIINEGKKHNLVVIDIWRCLVNENYQIIYDCYQSEPRNVTGAMEPYLFWNRIGRQRILRLIESKLEY